MDTGTQITKIRLEICPIVPPRHAIHSRGSARTDRPIRLPQTIDSHVVKKRGEPHILISARQLAHTIQIT